MISPEQTRQRLDASELTTTLRQPQAGAGRRRRLGGIVVRVAGTRTELTPPQGSTRLLGGRASPADLVLDDASVSARHFELVLREGDVLLRDLGSKNGTWIGGARVLEVVLSPGVEFYAGSVPIILEAVEAVEVVAHPAVEFGEMLGSSPAMAELFAVLSRLATRNLDVLVHGETGTGKELVTRALHRHSPRADRPLCVLDCSSLPRELAEAAIRGHAAGAFTGAREARPSCFEDANGGTLFLDEIGELPLDLQPKLLRVIDRREVQRIGENKVRNVDVRIVAATHRDLRQMVADGEFREDLYYRLASYTVEIPPLRERGSDVLLLAEHFLQHFSEGHDGPRNFSAAARARLLEHPWPGNVRELSRTISRAAQMAEGDLVEVTDLAIALGPGRAKSSLATAAPTSMPPPIEEHRREADRRYMTELLAYTGHNISEAARVANLSRRAIYDLLERLGISVR